MATLEEIKTDLRIAHTRLDDEIQQTMNACLLDLGMAGVLTIQMDALLDTAVKLYCRWQYDYCNKADQYQQAYIKLKQALSLCGDYNGGGG